MRGSFPTAREISDTSAPVSSHSAEMELMDDTRWARKALATSLLSSLDHMLVVTIFSLGTQFAYTCTSLSIAARPYHVPSPRPNPPDGASETTGKAWRRPRRGLLAGNLPWGSGRLR
eukprot:scaffold7381_cov310-Pinguiococcus_pyrenoidosus.AAC.15